MKTIVATFKSISHACRFYSEIRTKLSCNPYMKNRKVWISVSIHDSDNIEYFLRLVRMAEGLIKFR